MSQTLQKYRFGGPMRGFRDRFVSPLASLVGGLVRFGLTFSDDLCNSAFGAFGKSGLLWIVDVLLHGRNLHMCARKERICTTSSRPEGLNLASISSPLRVNLRSSYLRCTTSISKDF